MVYGEDDETKDLWTVVRENARRRQDAFRDAQRDGSLFLAECRDMWDRFDHDAGVYFVPCSSLEEVDALVDVCVPDEQYLHDRLLGIYHTTNALETQGAGISREAWCDLRERHHTAEELLERVGTPPEGPAHVPEPTFHPQEPPQWLVWFLVFMTLGILLVFVLDGC